MISIGFTEDEIKTLTTVLPVLCKQLEESLKKANTEPVKEYYRNRMAIIDSLGTKISHAAGIGYKGDHATLSDPIKIEHRPRIIATDEIVERPSDVAGDLQKMMQKDPEEIIDRLWETDPALMEKVLGNITAGMIRKTKRDLEDF